MALITGNVEREEVCVSTFIVDYAVRNTRLSEIHIMEEQSKQSCWGNREIVGKALFSAFPSRCVSELF
jgi:hypothetical protein